MMISLCFMSLGSFTHVLQHILISFNNPLDNILYMKIKI